MQVLAAACFTLSRHFPPLPATSRPALPAHTPQAAPPRSLSVASPQLLRSNGTDQLTFVAGRCSADSGIALDRQGRQVDWAHSWAVVCRPRHRPSMVWPRYGRDT
ncbi:hypothetical protein OH76DRAFT_837780 [Lentinus brumalis]|uniref:Uncharacterized protein n=1 Tax=Lentinus brumalis TaxID=2498619 RepID=A0A371D1J0_9APHY|nr:hypothetical protein OH76DRAFT_837780 [Polyporus brumalis]